MVRNPTDRLLAEIHAQPGDDAPRLVYADWLAERGDPRGELIALQCGPRTPAGARRAAALIRKHGKAWLGPLAPVLTTSYGFRRGFVATATARFKTVAAYRAHRDHPAWATIEELAFSVPPLFPPGQAAWRFGMSPAMTGLRVLRGHAEAIAAVDATWGVEELACRVDDRARLAPVVARMPRLVVLELAGAYVEPSWLDGIARLPIAELRVVDGDVAAWRAAAMRLGIATITITSTNTTIEVGARATPAASRAEGIVEPLAARATADGCWIAERQRLVLVDPARGATIRAIATNDSPAVAFARDAAVRVGERSEVVMLRDGNARRLGLALNARGASASDDGRVVAGSNGNICVAWDVAADRRIWEKAAVTGVVAVSPDGARVAFGANPPPGITVAPAVKGGRATKLGSFTALTGLCWLPDGTLVSAHRAAGVHHWDAAGRARLLAKLDGDGLAAAPGGDRVALRVRGVVHAISVATGAVTRLGPAAVHAVAATGVVLVGATAMLAR